MGLIGNWRRGAAVGAVLLALGALGACGDSDDASSNDGSAEDSGDGEFLGLNGPPEDASQEDFCAVALEAPGDDVDAIHDWAAEMAEVGTPEDIPDDAREGFELLVDTAKDISEEDLDNENFADEFSADEEDAFTAYGGYVGEACAGDIDPSEPDVS